jgi:hypothetical protein
MARTSEESPITRGLPRAAPTPGSALRGRGSAEERLSERGSAQKNVEENKTRLKKTWIMYGE